MNHMALQIVPHAAAAANAAASRPALVGHHQHKPLTPSMQTLLMRNAVAAGNHNHSIYNNRHAQARAQAQAHNTSQHDMNAAFHHQTVNRYQQMTKDFMMAQKLNQSLQQQLASKTSEAEDLKFRYYTDDKLMKSTIETLETKIRAQVREITQLRSELQQSQKSNNNENEATKPPPPLSAVQGSKTTALLYANHGDNNDRVVQQYQRQLQQLQSTTTTMTGIQENSHDDSFVSWLIKSKSGCPLCLTLDHTLPDCQILRSNGYLVTYHAFLDSQDSPSCTNTVATNHQHCSNRNDNNINNNCSNNNHEPPNHYREFGGFHHNHHRPFQGIIARHGVSGLSNEAAALLSHPEGHGSCDSQNISSRKPPPTSTASVSTITVAAATAAANANATINAAIASAAATTTTTPTITPTHCQEVIELLSDSDDDDDEKENEAETCDTGKNREASMDVVAEAALHTSNDKANANSKSNEGIPTTPSAANTVANSTSKSPPDSLEKTNDESSSRAKEQRYLASIQALRKRRMVVNSDENNGDDNDGDDDDNRENDAHDENDSDGTVTDEEFDTNVDNNVNDAEVDDEEDCASDGVENNDIIADIPTSSKLDPRLAGNCDFTSSSSDGIDNGRGGKDRPITIDFLEEEAVESIEKSSPLQTESEREQQEHRGSRITTDPDAETNNHNYTDEDEDDEIKIIGETGKNPLSDFAHPRYDCVIKPFSKDPEAFCPNCYCYVCDVRVSECEKWKLSGDEEEDSHCYAESKIVKWKRRRSKARNKRKLPERTLKNIAIFLKDTVPTKLPSKRKKREMIRYGQEGGDWNSDVQRSLRNNRRKTR
jgi:L-rhamnose mutarotase